MGTNQRRRFNNNNNSNGKGVSGDDGIGEIELTNTNKKSKKDTSSTRQQRRINNNKSNKRNTSYTFISSSFRHIQNNTWNAIFVLLLSILTGIIYNWWSGEHIVDETIKEFLYNFCNSNTDIVYCHFAIIPSRRTVRTTRVLQRGEIILEVPRKYTIWDIDALRNKWIQKELFNNITSNERQITSAAYLAVHLARLFNQYNTNTNNTSITDDDDDNTLVIEPIVSEYLSILPKTRTEFDYHPLLWSEEELVKLFGTHSVTYQYVIILQKIVHDEYITFQEASIRFTKEITYEQYLIARLIVLTRSFGTGPIQSNEALNHITIQDEIQLYNNTINIDLSRGCHALVPILDLYDHHAKPNVKFVYNTDKRSFIISTITTIPSGYEIFDSYGIRTDPDLFSKYGFVNGDGSEYTEANFGIMHNYEHDPIHFDPFQSDQLKRMLFYLLYDDGYETCISDPNDEDSTNNNNNNNTDAWELKKLKYKYLLNWANEQKRWIIRMPPRDKTSIPAARSNIPITRRPPIVDTRDLHYDGTFVFSTCRLIVLTHHDYNGTAIQMLKNNINKKTFVLPPTQDGLEFRTLFCIARSARTSLDKFGISLIDQIDLVGALNRNKDAYHSKNWTVQHLILGEMQTLEVIKQTAYTAVKKFNGKFNTEPAYTMRDETCPTKPLQTLLQDMVNEINESRQ